MKLVSAVMPTRARPELAQRALACFISQTYEPKELVILDDLEDPSFPCLDLPFVRYRRIDGHLNIPQKRNRVNGMCLGEIIIHWDSDDWSDAARMTDQVQRLEQSGLSVTAYHSILFHVEQNGEARKYNGATSYALGTSLCYYKSWWEKHPFPENRPLGEDNAFKDVARVARQILCVDAGSLMVARIHDGNTSPKRGGVGYVKVDPSVLPAGFFA